MITAKLKPRFNRDLSEPEKSAFSIRHSGIVHEVIKDFIPDDGRGKGEIEKYVKSVVKKNKKYS